LTARVGTAERRIFAGLTAFACGDAAGVPWETKRPEEINVQAIRRLPQTNDHGEPSAILAAVAVAAMGTFSIEGAPIDETIDHALAEAQIALGLLGVEEMLLAPIECAVKDAWQPPPNGVPFRACATSRPRAACVRACELLAASQ
jgi:hypothetical protein